MVIACFRFRKALITCCCIVWDYGHLLFFNPIIPDGESVISFFQAIKGLAEECIGKKQLLPKYPGWLSVSAKGFTCPLDCWY